MASELFAALADDLAQLIRLHDREIDADVLVALRQVDFPHQLALPATEPVAQQAWANMAAALAGPLSLDDLAADYAAIYLNNQYASSPYESVWLTDDHLACGAPMFELREIYAAAGWQAADWRQRFDDHLVLQMQYLQRQMSSSAVDPENLENFLDDHLGYWFPDFARQVSMRARTAFYAALVELTHVWLVQYRQVLADVTGRAIPTRDELAARINRKLALDKAEVAPIRFMPGQHGPSW